jgi:hypothetical protein
MLIRVSHVPLQFSSELMVRLLPKGRGQGAQ